MPDFFGGSPGWTIARLLTPFWNLWVIIMRLPEPQLDQYYDSNLLHRPWYDGSNLLRKKRAISLAPANYPLNFCADK